MNQACVSLDEVFAAAGARAASLVPETSGYLTLAVADATSRLPYLHDDRAVLLTVDGSVMVPRKTAIVAPSDAGRGLRDVLRRLLAASTGSMPGLTAAARPRSEEHDVEHVVADVEAALIPVNRAAAKRALARLARETLRAKEMGKLRKKPSQAPAAAKPQPAAATAPAPAINAQAAAAPAPAPAINAQAAAASAPVPAINAQAAAATTAAPAIAAPPAPPPLVVAPPEISPPPLVEIPPPPLVEIPPPPLVVAPHEIPPPPLVVAHEIPPPPLVVAPHEAPTASPAPVAVEPSAPPAGCDAASAPEAALHEPAAALQEPVAAWQGSDATILDPDAMAVLEAHDETATVAGTLVAEITERPPEIADLEDDDALTRPWQPGVAAVTVVVPAAPSAPDAPPSPAIAAPQDAPAPAETVRLETPTAAAAQSVLFTEPAGTRADELLDAFHAQDHDDALQAAARGLRAFTGVEETPPPAPPRGPARSAAPLSRREAPPVDEDDDLYLPPPRPRSPARSQWPLAVFALGVLVLFAAWLYRPTLAQSFFGLRDRVFPKPAPAAIEAPPPPSPQAEPERLTAEPAAPAAPARPREARAGDGPQRRRD